MSAALDDQEYFRKNISRVIEVREWFSREAGPWGIGSSLPKQILFFLNPRGRGGELNFFRALFDRKILTRHYDEEGLRDGVRMTIGTREEMACALQVLKEILPIL